MIRTLKVKKRLTWLYRKRPKGSRVVCFDEFGPFELRPHYGMHWARRRHPQRLPATYTRYHGVRHLPAFFDVHRDQFWGYFFQRKRWQETLRAFKRTETLSPHIVSSSAPYVGSSVTGTSAGITSPKRKHNIHY